MLFFRDYPKVHEPREMGEGISLLNRHLSAQLYQNPAEFRRTLWSFLRHRKLDGASILLSDHVATPQDLLRGLDAARSLLEDAEATTPWTALANDLRTHGFEAGWGSTAGDVAENSAGVRRGSTRSRPGKSTGSWPTGAASLPNRRSWKPSDSP